MAHFRDRKKICVALYRCTYCGNKRRATQMERVELQQYEYLYGELPLYNRTGWISP